MKYEDINWQSIAAYVYIVICIFDFMIIPMWIGFTRSEVDLGLAMTNIIKLDPAVQIKMIDAMTFQHEPLTLKGGGLFHMAFGAILTGTTIFSKDSK